LGVHAQMHRLILVVPRPRIMHVGELVEGELPIRFDEIGRSLRNLAARPAVELCERLHALVAWLARHRPRPPATRDERQSREGDAGEESVAERLVHVAYGIELPANRSGVDL